MIRSYKTEGFFFFDNVIVAHQVSDNEWGSFMHRIARLDSDCETVIDSGGASVYEHPAVFDCDGRTFIVMTEYHEDDTSMKPTVIYQLLPPPDSSMALESVEKRALMLMKHNGKMELASLLGLQKGEVAGVPKQEIAERVIRLKDAIERKMNA